MTRNTERYPQQRRTGVARFLPLLGWLPDYNRGVFRHDLVAGLTVGVMLVPQSMAYAALAGMPPVTGLYASIVPLVVYALLGTSGAAAVGPVALTALLTGAALAPLANGDPGRYVALAGLLALLVGAIQVTMGVLRLGAVVNFMSHSVLAGFTSAAAIIIAASQVKDLLGLDAEREDGFPQIVAGIWDTLHTVHGLTVVVSAVSILGLVLLKRFVPKLPGSLLVVVGVTAVSAMLGFGGRGVEILTEVPGGLPVPSLPSVTGADVTALLPTAFAIALVAYMESIAVAKALAAKSRRSINPDTELVAMGSANVSAGVFGAFPVAGGFARSAVNFAAGARTPVATVITAMVVAVTALAFTPAFYHLPKAVLGAIIVVAVLGLVDVTSAVTAWRARYVDGITFTLTFVATLAFGPEPGLAAGVVFSLGAFLWRSSRPHQAELGQVPGTTTFRNVARYDGLVTDPGIAVIRVDAPFYFANAHEVQNSLLSLAERRERLHTIVLDASAISDCDADGAHTLAELRERLADRGVTLRMATVRGPVRDLLSRTGLWQRLRGANHVHADVGTAVAAAGGFSPAVSRPAPEHLNDEVL